MVMNGNQFMGLLSWVILAIYFWFNVYRSRATWNHKIDILSPIRGVTWPSSEKYIFPGCNIRSLYCYIVNCGRYNGLRRLGLLFSILDPLQLLNKPPLNPLGTAHIVRLHDFLYM
jgi:hypothetical protein